jgi:hypothetical protein
VDGALLDNFRLTHGFWEAKDSRDDLPTEARKKFDLGGRGAIVGAVNTHE